ncbi:MAG: N-acetylneuraminate synthase family protein [Hyphomonadaceae bacterium]
MKPFSLAARAYDYLSPYIIAEIGVNHEGDVDRAKRMIDAAAKGGAHAAKFQTYKADKLAARGTSPAYWDRTKEAADSQHTLFQRWDNFGDNEYKALAAHCADAGVDFLSTPFDLEAVDLLAPLMPAFKVASADITNVPLLRKIAAMGKPIVMSTGASRFDEVATALDILEEAGAAEVTLLHCILNYPTEPKNAELAQIGALQRAFGERCAIGYSDHVKPDADGAMPALDMAVLMGAVVLEKHFTDDKAGVGNDHYHAMDGRDLAAFTEKLARLRELHGTGKRDLSGQSRAIENARRRIVAARDIGAGETLREADLIALRSNTGVEIAHWDGVLGRTVRRAVASGQPLDWADIQ